MTLEFAIVAPIFFLLVLGIIEIGRGVMVRHMLTNAARQGCRLGIIEGTSNAQINNAATAALAPTGISNDSVTVQVNDGSSDAANALPGDEITVVVSVPVQNISWVPNLQFLSGSLSGQYTMRRE
ncbi:MAG TPA: TadE/TadG family type IV pilus assembly protein [Gemmataceae bacterium]|nr:TadE/TadG family type IV pilus assembly protein [Gemmataceae bacterium]